MSSTTPPDPAATGSARAAAPALARRARGALATLFLVNGAVLASLVPRYPDVKQRLDLSNAELGSAISAAWLGALVVGLSAGALVTRFGAGRVAWVATVGAALDLALVGLASSWAALAGALCVAGALGTFADVGENAHALRVERLYARSILNSLHGAWSVGAVAGALAGSAAAGLDVPLGLHLSLSGAVFAVLAVAASRFLLPETGTATGAETGAGVSSGGDGRRPRRRRQRWQRRGRGARAAILPAVALGVFAALAQAVEETGATWSALYLRGELGAAPALAGAGFVALQLMQTLGRLLGDRAVTRYGDRAVARAGVIVAGVGAAAALTTTSPGATIAGFGAAGLGIATLLPAAARHVDALPGLAPGVGLTMLGAVSALGGLAAAPLVGLLADAYGLRAALLTIPAATVALLLLTPLLHRTPWTSRGSSAATS